MRSKDMMTAYCYLAVLLIGGSQHASEPRTDLDNSIVWRAERVCGVNCIYLMLRANDKQVDYPMLQRRLLKHDLNSLTDLKRAAEGGGLFTNIARTDPVGLLRLTKPLIAHLEVVSVRGEPSAHFVLVTNTDRERVSYIDGTTAEPLTVSWKEFARDWSGNILISAQPRYRRFWPYAAMAALGLGAAFAVEKLKHKSVKPFEGRNS